MFCKNLFVKLYHDDSDIPLPIFSFTSYLKVQSVFAIFKMLKDTITDQGSLELGVLPAIDIS